ncbi:hypothetical protein NL676_007120 [Syzygium grande]|nr:hypothetical protein NL676_007120 [Syzygium grande]
MRLTATGESRHDSEVALSTARSFRPRGATVPNCLDPFFNPTALPVLLPNRTGWKPESAGSGIRCHLYA